MASTEHDKLGEFGSVLSEAESLLGKASKETGDRARDLRSQVEARLLSAKLKLQELEGESLDRARAVARYTDDYVHDHPWQVIGIAAVIGVVLGALVRLPRMSGGLPGSPVTDPPPPPPARNRAR